MRRSAAVTAPLLGSMAVALLSGCHSTEMERCVDEGNRVVDPSFCKNLPPNSSQGLAGRPNNGGVFIPHVYRYYYGGSGSYAPGSMVTGGSFAPIAGHSYSTTTGTSRGGFGSSFSSGHGGGEGGGE